MTFASPLAAFAKEKSTKEKPAAPKINASRAYKKAAKKIQAALIAKDVAALAEVLEEGDAAASTPEDRYFQAQFRLQLGLMIKDTVMQESSLDSLIDSGFSPVEDIGKLSYYSGRFAYERKDYAKAAKRLGEAQRSGYEDSQLDLLLLDSHLRLDRLDSAVSVARVHIDAQHAKGSKPVEEVYVRVAQALQEAERQEDLYDFLAMRLADYPAAAAWRNTLYIHMQGEEQGDSFDRSMSLDILRLMRATDAMMERSEYSEYADMAAQTGLPGEAISIIEEGRRKKIFESTDEILNEAYEDQKQRAIEDKAGLDADVEDARGFSDGSRALGVADALFGYDDYARAVSLYELALSKGGIDTDRANLQLGVAQFFDSNLDSASVALHKVVEAEGKRKNLAQLWLVFLEHQRPTAITQPPSHQSPQ